MRRLPPLTALEAFVQVARLGSIKAAAEELALSTPALSRRVQALERFIGRPLFERRHQLLEINADGERLLESIAPALDSLAVAIDDMTVSARMMKLRLSVLPLYAGQMVFPRLGELRQRYPDLHLDIDTSANAMSRLGDGIDAAIVLTTDPDPALYALELSQDIIYPIAERGLAEGPDALPGPEALARQTILIHRDMPGLFDAWKNAVGLPALKPAAIDYFDSGQLMLEAAAQGLGIAFMLAGHLEHAHDARLARLFDVQVKSPYRYYFVCRQRALDNRPVRIFRDWLAESTQKPE